MSELLKFSDEAVHSALSLAQAQHQESAMRQESVLSLDTEHLSMLAECIEVTLENGKLCVVLPLGLGKACVPFLNIYNGKVARACISLCTTFGIPTGVKLTVSVAGTVIVSKTFGKC